ncbi:MAG: 23S rRNA (guanosine2251-2'-O)-methyltransferase [Candidatus Promineifilaceae bacterium]|jgi:23S rRNA (guanosine2251-2'-O)-methyltransferase
MKKHRRHSGLSRGTNQNILFGQQPVHEALRAGRRVINRVFLLNGRSDANQMRNIETLANAARIPIEQVESEWMERQCDGGNHQGVAADVAGFPYSSMDEILAAARKAEQDPFVLFLDHIQDPQNLGAVLRVACCAGAHGVVIPSDRAAGVTPAVSRASAGGAEHVRVACVTNLVQTIRTYKDAGGWIYGLDAREGAVPYTETDLKGPVGIVVGSEGVGLGRLVGETCDGLMRLPMSGVLDSLNAATAAAIATYEVLRQRALPKS